VRQHRGGEGYTVGDGDGRGGEDDGRVGRGSGNVPFEFVGEVASAGAVAEARDVERGTTTAGHLVKIVGCLCGVVLRDLQVRQIAVVRELVMMLKVVDEASPGERRSAGPSFRVRASELGALSS
jgi:hypothetical protein